MGPAGRALVERDWEQMGRCVGGCRSGDGGVGTMVAGAGRYCWVVSAVLVSVAKVAAKIDKGFVGVGFSAPFLAAGNIEHASALMMF